MSENLNKNDNLEPKEVKVDMTTEQLEEVVQSAIRKDRKDLWQTIELVLIVISLIGVFAWQKGAFGDPYEHRRVYDASPEAILEAQENASKKETGSTPAPSKKSSPKANSQDYGSMTIDELLDLIYDEDEKAFDYYVKTYIEQDLYPSEDILTYMLFFRRNVNADETDMDLYIEGYLEMVDYNPQPGNFQLFAENYIYDLGAEDSYIYDVGELSWYFEHGPDVQEKLDHYFG